MIEIKTAEFKTAIAEIIQTPNDGDFKHPYLTVAKFVFADDKGATTSTSNSGLMQGIEFEDFDEVIQTSIDTPVKMRLLGDSLGNHLGAYTVGHIKSMDKAQAADGTNQLIATAVLYHEEYPEEVEFLKKSYASGEAPGISYEMGYQDSIIKNGVQWLKKMITSAATFVRSPAYGKRTSLLALASAKDDPEFIQRMKDLVALAEGQSGTTKPEIKGGNNQVDELETAKKEITTLKAEAETKTGELSRLTEEITAKDTEITTLKAENVKLQNEKVLGERIRAYADAGMTLEAEAEKAEAKKTFLLAMSDDIFTQYIADIKSLKAQASTTPKQVALASAKTSIPRPEVLTDSSRVSFNFRDN